MPPTPDQAHVIIYSRPGCHLCDEAKANQIVVSQRVFGMVEPWAEGRPLEDLTLKGFNHPVLAVEILGWREEGADQAEAAAPAAERRRQRPV